MCKTHFFSFATLYEKVLQHPHAITIFEDFVYWTDRYINRVMRAHKWHGENQTVMLFNLPQPMGLVAVHPARQPAGMTRIMNIIRSLSELDNPETVKVNHSFIHL